MTVLFVCRWNQGRSQIAEALFNKYTAKHTATSAGTQANEFPGITLLTCAPLVVRVLREWNINVADKTTRRLTQEMTDNADKIVFMSKDGQLPDMLTDTNKVIIWPVSDPDGQGYDYHVTMRNQIDGLVKDFLSKME